MTVLVARPFGECLLAIGVDRGPRHAKRQAGKPIHLDKNGYPRAWDPKRRRQAFAHRMVVEWMRGGPLGDDEVVHHRCHRRVCIEPSHLQVMSRNEHAQLHARLRREARAA